MSRGEFPSKVDMLRMQPGMVIVVRWCVVGYPLGWSLTTRIWVWRERWPGGYGMRYFPLVRPGDNVQPNQPVMRQQRVDVALPLASVPRLSLPMVAMQGVAAPAGHLAPLKSEVLLAGLCGKVVAVTPRGGVVIQGLVSVVSGAVGIGRQVAGPLTFWQTSDGTRERPIIPPGAILVMPGPLTLTMLRQMLNLGISGLVASSICFQDLEHFLHTNLLDVLNCPNVDLLLTRLPPLTILLTEGLGNIPMPGRTIDLLREHQGEIALLAGTSSIRAGTYPELVVSLSEEEVKNGWQPLAIDLTLRAGALVRVCSGNHDGSIGEIDYLFASQQSFPSGVRARAARVCLEDGTLLIVPLSVLERIG